MVWKVKMWITVVFQVRGKPISSSVMSTGSSCSINLRSPGVLALCIALQYAIR
jgi:hypothetical protein